MQRSYRSESLGFDWRLVRGLGQLHVLNRTSLLLVIVVPILASIWPVVQHTLMWYDGLLSGIEEDLARVLAAIPQGPIEASTGGPTGDPDVLTNALTAELQQLRGRIEQLRVRSSGRLPIIWGLLFFASLAVLLGRTIFQLTCPEIVRDFRADEYTRERMREYSESPSLGAVARAISHLEEISIAEDLIDEEKRSELTTEEELLEIKQRLNSAEAEQAQLKVEREAAPDKFSWDDLNRNHLRSVEDEARSLRDEWRRLAERDRGDRGPDFRRKMALIELSAMNYYREEASRSRAAMLLCALVYLVALWMLGDIFLRQARLVASAVGWL